MSIPYEKIEINGEFNIKLPEGSRRHRVYKTPLPQGKGFYPEWDNVNKKWEGLFVVISYLPGVCRVKAIRESATSSWWDRDDSNNESNGGVGVEISSWEPCSFRFDTLAQGDPMDSGGVRIKVGDKYLSEEEIINLCYEAAIKCRRPISDKREVHSQEVYPTTNPKERGSRYSPDTDGGGSGSYSTPLLTMSGPLGFITLEPLLMSSLIYGLYQVYDPFPVCYNILGTPGGVPEVGWLLLISWVIYSITLLGVIRGYLRDTILVWRKKPRLPKIPGVEVKAFF
jgi:hypothetical protein